MAESYYGHSKSRSSNSFKGEEFNKCRSKKSRITRDSSKSHQMESKTPPLPIKSNCSMEELLKQRETLKKELKYIAKHCDNFETKYKHNKEEKRSSHTSYHSSKTHSRKRHTKGDEDENNIKKKRSVKDVSPEYIHDESEDEETIIEQRRRQRKQLLEKLADSQEKTNKSEDTNLTENNESRINNKSQNENNEETKPEEKKVIKESTDMFAEKDEFASCSVPDRVTQDNDVSNAQLTDNWDDSEGYYNVRVGDMINNNRYTIKSILGQGVFANVVRAQDNSGNSQGNSDVAIKIVRNNELMYKTSLKEISIIKDINEADPEDKYHCVKMLRHFMHKGHLCMVLESLHMDLRSIIKKYGKHHGINMKALMSYSRQLLLALRHLKKVGIIHADIKPDNILVNEKKNVLKLCDFGSAAKASDNEPTPYLVSRFYRAPEIILGIPYQHGVDMWSTACTIYEMGTGKIMFTGSSNNKMLKCFMDVKGRIPSRLIRKGKFKDQHFNYNNNFLFHKKDELTGREKVVEMGNITPKRDLLKELKKSCKSPGEEKKIVQLHDLLDKMTALDPNQRLSVNDCLKHSFIQEPLQK